MKCYLSIPILSCVLALGSLLLVSCEPDKVCHQEMQVYMQVALSADSLDAEGEVVNYSQWDSVRVIGIGTDVGIIGRNTKSLKLELRPDTIMTQFLMLYHNQVDTLCIEHTPMLHYVSMACGCQMYHTITRAWSTDMRVDSVSIINASIESVAQVNLCVFMHE